MPACQSHGCSFGVLWGCVNDYNDLGDYPGQARQLRLRGSPPARCAGDPRAWACSPGTGITLGEFGPKYKQVLSNFPLKGCYKYEPAQLGRYDVSGCLILCDESSLVFYSRDYKNNDRTALDWLCLHGHYCTDLVFASQGLQDCDKRIRNLTGQLVHITKRGGFSWLTPVNPAELPDDPTKEQYLPGSTLQSKPLRRKKILRDV